MRYGGAVATVRGMKPRRSIGDPFGALGDENRRAIVALLRDQPRSVQEIADALPISRPAVSRHLRLLETAGLVTHRADGTRSLYRLDIVGAETARQYLAEMWGEATARFRLVAENTSSKPRRGKKRR